MRASRSIVAALIVVLATAGVSHAQSDGSFQPTSVDDFWDALAPYGEWLDVTNYGRVWRPYPDLVGTDFTPYLTGGQWVNSDYGWYFASEWDDQFGWAVFHYGRWAWDQELGWLWFADTRWGPAWVRWNVSEDSVAWYPSAPAGIATTRVSITWIIVPQQSFSAPDLPRNAARSGRVFGGRPVPPAQRGATVNVVWRGRPPSVATRPARQVPPRVVGATSWVPAPGPGILPPARSTPPSGVGYPVGAVPVPAAAPVMRAAPVAPVQPVMRAVPPAPQPMMRAVPPAAHGNRR